jgi:hypothetical protein
MYLCSLGDNFGAERRPCLQYSLALIISLEDIQPTVALDLLFRSGLVDGGHGLPVIRGIYISHAKITPAKYLHKLQYISRHANSGVCFQFRQLH